jgi:hypothetical protein
MVRIALRPDPRILSENEVLAQALPDALRKAASINNGTIL